jgi:hypothetical protein
MKAVLPKKCPCMPNLAVRKTDRGSPAAARSLGTTVKSLRAAALPNRRTE